MVKRTHPKTIFFKGFSELSFADFGARKPIKIEYAAVTPADRGNIIRNERDLRDCPMSTLVGDVVLRAPRLEAREIKRRLSQYLCWHPNPNARTAAEQILEIPLEEIAQDFECLAIDHPDYCEALLALDFARADEIVVDSELSAEEAEVADGLRASMTMIANAFTVQQTAAWAWKIRNNPFDGAIGDHNRDGPVKVGTVRSELDLRYEHFERAYNLHRSGSEKAGKAFRMLDRYGLSELRGIGKRQLVETVGPERIVHLSADLDQCAVEAEAMKMIWDEIDRIDATEDEPLNFRRMNLDRFLTKVPANVILAMRCASLAEAIVMAADVDWYTPPTWLLKPRSKGLAEESRLLFYQLFLFYRAVIVQDSASLTINIPANDFRSQDKVELLTDLHRASKEQCRDVVRAMRACAANDSFGDGPEIPGRVAEFADKFGWRETG